jgi:hypothetical protein
VASLVPTAAAAATLLEVAWYAADHIPGFHGSVALSDRRACLAGASFGPADQMTLASSANTTPSRRREGSLVAIS